MVYGTGFGLANATAAIRKRIAVRIIDQVWATLRPMCVDAFLVFLEKPVSGVAFLAFERALFGLVRELACLLVEALINALEPVWNRASITQG